MNKKNKKGRKIPKGLQPNNSAVIPILLPSCRLDNSEFLMVMKIGELQKFMTLTESYLNGKMVDNKYLTKDDLLKEIEKYKQNIKLWKTLSL